MVQPHAVLEVSDGVLDLGVAPMVGIQCQGFPLPVGDEAVIVGGEEGQLGTGRGLTRRTEPIVAQARRQRLLSEEHFSVDGMLLEAWA